MIIVYILGGALALVILYLLALALYGYTKRVFYDLQLLALDIAQRRISLTRTIYPMEGEYPLLWSGDTLLDPARALVFTWAGLQAATPEVAKPEQLARLLRAAGGWPVGVAAENLLPSPSAQWPSEIPLKSVVSEPDIRGLVLGVTVGEDGRQETVRADMGDLVHIAVGGSSGWGKSVFLRALAWQLAMSQSPTDLVMIDLEGATLAPFARCGRLLYPIADTEADALAVLRALQDEMERRKALYAEFPGVDGLRAYNATAGEPLTPLVAIIDEATALLGDKSVEGALRTLALRARKYGLWLVLAGQDWKASSLDTAIRNQLSSRVQFKAMSASQSRVLLEQGGAEDLDAKGRAWAVIPGKSPFLMQAPYISAKVIMEDVSDSGARYPIPGDVSQGPELVKQVRALYTEGLGLGAIADKVFGYRNARKTAEIKDILGLS